MAVLDGAEPYSAAGGRAGALVLHGFTGSPQSMRPLAVALADAGFTVELPLLPGHGTTVEDMITTSWEDWDGAAQAVYADLASRVDTVTVLGLSMGGTLALWVALANPGVAGVVTVNAMAAVTDPALPVGVREMVDSGLDRIPGIGSDIADPDSSELAYAEMPLAPLLSLLEAVEGIGARLAEITCPALVMHSPQDHVVPPESSDHLAAALGGPVERVVLERSYHVATLDHDRPVIEQQAVAFARKVSGTG